MNKIPFTASGLWSRRKALNMSQRELARRSGVSAASISQYEAGQDLPGLKALLALGEALNVIFEANWQVVKK